jgi:hypothetical protein
VFDHVGVVFSDLGRSGALLVGAALLLACDSGNDNATTIDAPTRARTQAEQIAEAMREAQLISQEMQSIDGPSLRARVERGGEPLLVATPEPVASVGQGFFSIDARLDDGAVVTVYVPDDVVVPAGALIQVVAGQHGHYFRALVSN